MSNKTLDINPFKVGDLSEWIEDELKDTPFKIIFRMPEKIRYKLFRIAGFNVKYIIFSSLIYLEHRGKFIGWYYTWKKDKVRFSRPTHVNCRCEI